jgi:hypothetical protein
MRNVVDQLITKYLTIFPLAIFQECLLFTKPWNLGSQKEVSICCYTFSLSYALYRDFLWKYKQRMPDEPGQRTIYRDQVARVARSKHDLP